MVIGGISFLIMMMTNWTALAYASISIETNTTTNNTDTQWNPDPERNVTWPTFIDESENTDENAFWIQIILSWMAAGLYIFSIMRMYGSGEEEEDEEAQQ